MPPSITPHSSNRTIASIWKKKKCLQTRALLIDQSSKKKKKIRRKDCTILLRRDTLSAARLEQSRVSPLLFFLSSFFSNVTPSIFPWNVSWSVSRSRWFYPMVVSIATDKAARPLEEGCDNSRALSRCASTRPPVSCRVTRMGRER